MNSEANQTAELPVPRAERFLPSAKRHSEGGEDWYICMEESTVFVMSEKDGTWYMSEMAAQYRVPTSYFLALIESAKLREELAEARKQAAPDTGFCDLLGIARGSGLPEVHEKIRSLKACNSDGWTQASELNGKLEEANRWYDDLRGKYRVESRQFRETSEQLDHLATFIGHPGTTAAHVVTETVSLIEKFVDAARRTGIQTEGRALSTVAEDTVAKSHRAAPFRQTLENAAKFFGVPLTANGSEVFKAIHDIYNDAVRQSNEMLAGGRLVCAELGLPDGAGVDEVVECIRKKRYDRETDHVRQWRDCSESWQRRALAAESQIAGPPDEHRGCKIKSAFGDPEVQEGLKRCFEEFIRRDFEGAPTIANFFRPFEEDRGLQHIAEHAAPADLHQTHVDLHNRQLEANELRSLRQFNRVVRRLFGIPAAADTGAALVMLADYLDAAEERG